LIVRFELFGYTFLFGKLIYQPKEHILCLLVNVGKIGGELAACKQIAAISEFYPKEKQKVNIRPEQPHHESA
jgi:hypothetical protein